MIDGAGTVRTGAADADELREIAALRIARDGTALSANAAFRRLVGMEIDEPLHRLFEDYILLPSVLEVILAQVGGTDTETGPGLGLRAQLAHDPSARVFLELFADRRAPEKAVFARAWPLSDLRHAGRRAADLRARDEYIGKLEASINSSQLALWHLNITTRDTWFSGLWYETLGYEVDQFAASFETFAELVHPDDMPTVMAALQPLMDGKAGRYHADFRMKHANGNWVWIGATGARFISRTNPDEVFICGTQARIDRRKEAELQLEKSLAETRFATERLVRLADNAPGGFFEYHVDGEGRISLPYAHPVVLELLGVSKQQVDQNPEQMFANIDERDMPRMSQAIEESSGGLSKFEVKYRVNHPERGERWILASSNPVREADGSIRWYGFLFDVTSDVLREQQLAALHRNEMRLRHEVERAALADSLTGLYNRRAFDEEIQARQRSGGDADCVLLRIDLDYFKYVNDTLGHEAGDAVLKHVADMLRECTRVGDFPARVGGDEFSVLMAPDTNMNDVERVIDRLRDRLAEPFFFEGKPCRFGASIGIATSAATKGTTAELLTFADVALYEAKGKGRNRTEMFTPELHRTVLSERRLAVDIQLGLEAGEFECFYQPQIDAVTGEISGFEALARWNRGDHGIQTPDRFIPVARKLNILADLDKAIFEAAMDDLLFWRDQGLRPRKLAFNVSSGRLNDPDLMAIAPRLMAAETVVAFELLESILIEEESAIFRFNLDKARDAGFEIEIDDFGSGHASIVSLQQIMPSTLKIDRRLIRGVAESTQSRELLGAIIQMGKALGIGIIAEGTETRAQVDILRKLGCDAFQGYYFARPMNREDTLAFARGHRADWLSDKGEVA